MTDAAMTLHPDDEIVWSPKRKQDGTGFSATTERGLLVTRDDGASWMPAFAAIPDAMTLPATAVAISPRFSGDGLVVAAIPGGIGRSSDRGATWEFASLPGVLPIVTCLLIVPDRERGNDPLLLAGTLEDGVARSVDGGRTWSFWNGGLFDREVIHLDADVRDDLAVIVTAITPSGTYASVNAGRAWHPVPEPQSQPPDRA